MSTSVDGSPPSKYFRFANSQGNCSSGKCLDLKKKLQEVSFSYGIWSASIKEVAFNAARAARLVILLTWTLLVDMIYA
jgi:hypothetical protein